MNDIPEKQNGEQGQRLLKARQRIYARATRLQVFEFVSIVLVPSIGAVVGLFVPDARAFVAAMSLFLLTVDIVLIDRWMRRKLKLAAQLSEAFDCFVLDMHWNEMVVGRRPQEEDIIEAALAYPTSTKAIEAVRDWYPVVVGRAPLHIARLACQRTNLWYDAQLRGKYTFLLLGIPMLAVVVCIVFGAAFRLNFDSIVLTLIAPATPVVVWSLRERNRQRDAADAQTATIATADTLFEKIKLQGCSEAECSRQSREFQDAIFARRAGNPLIFPLIYKLYRKTTEAQMNLGAEERLRQLGY